MLSRCEDHGSRPLFKRNQKGKTMLLDYVPLSMNDDDAIESRMRREEALNELKGILGEHYLLHPSNYIQRKSDKLRRFNSED